jgi:hypothetical protein
MTEAVAEYRVEPKPKQVGAVWRHCPQCNMVYGYEINGGKFLYVGKLRMIAMRSECSDCGNTIWWYSSDRHMRKLTKRSK